jgi:hypothetical protein
MVTKDTKAWKSLIIMIRICLRNFQILKVILYSIDLTLSFFFKPSSTALLWNTNSVKKSTQEMIWYQRKSWEHARTIIWSMFNFSSLQRTSVLESRKRLTFSLLLSSYLRSSIWHFWSRSVSLQINWLISWFLFWSQDSPSSKIKAYNILIMMLN